MYEDSLCAPFIIWGPGVQAGAKFDVPIYIQDAMATALDIAGANKPEYIEYKSVLPILSGEADQNYDSMYGAYMNTQRMILRDGWKVIAYPQLKKVKLFNLEKDPLEMNDLASNPEYAGKLKQLTELLEQQMDVMGDPMTSLAKADFNDKSAKAKKGEH
jgi:arylsulfatase A-like enzyme